MDTPAILGDLTSIMQRFYAAEADYVEAGRQSFALIADLLHTDCTMHAPESLPYGGVWQGHDGFERWTKAFADFWSRLEVANPKFYQIGPDNLFIRSHAHGTIRANGVDIKWPLLQQVRFEKGLIADVWPFYWDSGAIVEAMKQ